MQFYWLYNFCCCLLGKWLLGDIGFLTAVPQVATRKLQRCRIASHVSSSYNASTAAAHQSWNCAARRVSVTEETNQENAGQAELWENSMSVLLLELRCRGTTPQTSTLCVCGVRGGFLLSGPPSLALSSPYRSSNWRLFMLAAEINILPELERQRCRAPSGTAGEQSQSRGGETWLPSISNRIER